MKTLTVHMRNGSVASFPIEQKWTIADLTAPTGFLFVARDGIEHFIPTESVLAAYLDTTKE